MITINKNLIVFTITSVIFITACNNSEPKDPKEMSNEVNESRVPENKQDDAEALVSAYASGLYEINLSDTVMKYAVTEDAKTLAKMVGDGHRVLNTQIKDLAEKNNISLPMKISTEQMEAINDLIKNKDFDKAYAGQMVTKHKKSVDLYEKCSMDCQEASIKNWFAGALPEIKKHLDMAETTEQKLKS